MSCSLHPAGLQRSPEVLHRHPGADAAHCGRLLGHGVAGEEQHHHHGYKTEGEQRGEGTQSALLHTTKNSLHLSSCHKQNPTVCSFQKCELYWPQPKERGTGVKEEDEEEEQKEKEEDEGETGRFGRFILKVKDSREKDGFTVTDMEVQVQ